MRRISILSVVMLMIAVISGGCGGDENITNNYAIESNGSIFGRVMPAQPGVEVAAWQASEVKSTVTDDGGYFMLADMVPGLYEVRIAVPGGSERIISEVEVQPAAGTSLGEIAVSLMIVRREYPNGLDNIPPAGAAVLIYYYSMPMYLGEVGSHITIDPPAEISVYGAYYSDYQLRVEVTDLIPSVTYTMTIDADLEALDGSTTGEIETIIFQTEALKVMSCGFYEGYDWDSIATPGSMFNCRLQINADVDPDSLNTAVSIDPPIAGFWYPSSDYYYGHGRYLYFFPTGANELLPEQVITITIDGSVGLIDNVGFGTDTILTLGVYPVMITSIYPESGNRNVYIDSDIRVYFNTDMNHASVESAFSMTTWDDVSVDGSFYWRDYYEGGEYLEFDPSAYLDAGQVYKVTVNMTARSLTGHYLDGAGYTFFMTRD